MTRIDLGALVSRAMAIWLLASAFHGIPASLHSFFNTQGLELRDKFIVWLPAVLILIKLVVVALLWVKAAGFGQWLDKASSADSPPVSLSREPTTTAVLQGVAAYWFVIMTIDLAVTKADQATDPEAEVATLANAAGLGWVHVILWILSIVLLLNARGVSRRLCAA